MHWPPPGRVVPCCSLAVCGSQSLLPIHTMDFGPQIEIFTWSASGAIVTELFASSFPTMVVYVVDTPRVANPQTFMSNMLQVGGGQHAAGAAVARPEEAGHTSPASNHAYGPVWDVVQRLQLFVLQHCTCTEGQSPA